MKQTIFTMYTYVSMYAVEFNIIFDISVLVQHGVSFCVYWYWFFSSTDADWNSAQF